MKTSRRSFIKTSSLMLTFTLGSKSLLLTPAEARAQKLPLQVLSNAEAGLLEALADALVPGAKAAGISHYVDSQLQAKAEDCLLMIRYLGVPPPYNTFYSSGLESTATLATTRYKKNLIALDTERFSKLIDELAQGNVENWQGPPAPFFYFVLRADAADVVYGTRQGFDYLNIPYMPHISPKQPW